ncbi:hypothetical protein RUND412_010840 [Rhizina undulata]
MNTSTKQLQLPASAQSVAGESKLQHVHRLLDVLKLDSTEKTLFPSQRVAVLEQLKVLGRDPQQCDPMYTEEGIETLCKHGFNVTDGNSSREGLRCLVNALLIAPRTRQIFVDLGYAEKAADKYESDSSDDEFLLARILFLITYDTKADLIKLLEEHHLDDHINNAIARHSKLYSKHFKSRTPTPMQDMALSETLKLLFNILHFIPDKLQNFSKSAANLFKILSRRQLENPPIQPPVTYLINALLNIGLSSCVAHAFPLFDNLCNVTKLIEILDLSTDERYTNPGADSAQEFDEVGAPLLTLLRKMNEIAPDSAKKYMQNRLLPTEDDRNQPLGRGSSLSARLLNLSCSALAPTTREHVSSLLFELSNSDSVEFVRNVGYGFASGFLMSHNILVPQNAMEANAQGTSSQNAINPITGQTLESERVATDPIKDMSEEEKEREAERLFVLFERLKKIGVIDVKNPVQQAIDEGRFEEID